MQNFNHYKLPVTLEPANYGNIINISKIDSDNTLYIVQLENGNVFNILSKRINNLIINDVKLFRNGLLVIQFSDTQISETEFDRLINNKHYFFNIDGTLLFHHVEKPTRFIQPIKPHLAIDEKIMTLDIETYICKSEIY